MEVEGEAPNSGRGEEEGRKCSIRYNDLKKNQKA